MKKIILLVCSIVFFVLIFPNKRIEIIGFYQDSNNQIKNNKLFFKTNYQASYHKLYIYNENELIDIKETKDNFFDLTYIRSLNEKMYIQIISYNNKNEELFISDKKIINWSYPYIKINDNKVVIENKNNQNYDLYLITKNDQKLIEENEIINNDSEIYLYQDDILINKTSFLKEEIIVNYPLNNISVVPSDFYISIDTNYRCVLTLSDKTKNKIVFENVFDCEYLVNGNQLEENHEYLLHINYYEKDSAYLIKNDQVNFKTSTHQLLDVIANNLKEEVLEGTKISLKAPNGGDIYYTLDGNNPNQNSYKYVEPIEIKEDTIIKTIAKNDKKESQVKTYSYKVIKDVPFIYLSPSRQTQNIGVARAGYTTEKDVMTKLAILLEQELIKNNIKVYRAPQSTDLDERVKESNKLGSDIYLALHTNATTSGFPLEGKGRGIQSYIARPESNMLEFAKIVQSELMSIYDGPVSRSGVKFGTETKMMYEINEKNVKNGILLEIGFHDNYEDACWIINNLERIAKMITSAIKKNFQI